MGKTVLLLGTGAMGSFAAQVVAGFGEAKRLILASLDKSEAERVVPRCGGKASAEAVDVTDRERLTALMRRADLVLNCVGPFFRFGVPILEAAIDAGTDYLDICDDPEPTRRMLDLDDRARAAGVTAVVGMGASPGVTNLLGALVRERLDQVDLMAAGWNIEEETDDALAFSAAVVHWMEQCSGTILECRDGVLSEVRPLEDLEIDYPGRGRRTLYTVGHPEPVSFHRSWPEVAQTRCAMVMPSAWIGLFRHYQEAIDSGRMTLEEAGRDLVASAGEPSILDAVRTALSRLLDGPRLPLFFVHGRGRRNGRRTTVAASLGSVPPDVASMTGIPLALGALMHMRGLTPGPGVAAPEKAFDPGTFFELFAPYCTLPPLEPGDNLVDLAVSS